MKNKIFYFGFVAFILSSCTQPPAPITYNHNKNFVNKSTNVSSYSTKYSENDEGTIINRELDEHDKDFDHPTGFLKEPNSQLDKNQDDNILVVPKVKPDNSKIIYHEVEKSETLESIANDYSQATEELALLNDISPPYDLGERKIIKIRVTQEILNKKNREASVNRISNIQQIPSDKPIQDVSQAQISQSKYIKPVTGIIINKFGQQTPNGKSKGVDIAANAGDSVKSIADGKVVFAGNDKKFGNLLIIKLDDSELFVAYAHLQDLIIQKGSVIKQGQVIGHVGSTGEAHRPQLHLAIRDGKIAVDPLKYVNYR